jgi:hypothetical protein
MGNILNTDDIINAIKKIEKDCELGAGFGKVTIDHAKFYERVKGLMVLVEENLDNKKSGGHWV